MSRYLSAFCRANASVRTLFKDDMLRFVVRGVGVHNVVIDGSLLSPLIVHGVFQYKIKLLILQDIVFFQQIVMDGSLFGTLKIYGLFLHQLGLLNY